MLIERWYPVTSDLGLVNAPVDACVAAFTAWHDSIGLRYDRQHATSLESCLDLLPPLSAEQRRKAFLPTSAPGWTVLLQSGITGSDPYSDASMLAANLLRVLGMRVCATPAASRYPAIIWEVYAPPELGGDSLSGFRRTVSAVNDGGRWVFDQSGEPYPFERSAGYGPTRKRDRFTRDMLVSYLAEFGLDPLSDSFYTATTGTPAVVLERTSRWDNAPPEFTLEEVLEGLPWRQR